MVTLQSFLVHPFSLTTTPTMCAFLLKSERNRRHGWIYRANERFFAELLNTYQHSLTWVLRNPSVLCSVMARRLGLSQSLVSHHLRLLRAARFLKARRKGKQMFYSIADCHVREMLTNMIEHLAEPHEHDEDITETCAIP